MLFLENQRIIVVSGKSEIELQPCRDPYYQNVDKTIRRVKEVYKLVQTTGQTLDKLMFVDFLICYFGLPFTLFYASGIFELFTKYQVVQGLPEATVIFVKKPNQYYLLFRHRPFY